MSTNIGEQICQAVDILVEKAISQAPYDRTVQATIIKTSDASIGQYLVEFQGSKFYACAANPDITFADKTTVYVLIPGNDMKRDKTILGAVKTLGANFNNNITKEDIYNEIGSNIIINSPEANLISYKNPDSLILYNKEKEINIVSIDTIELENIFKYNQKVSHIICGGAFKTNLPKEQQTVNGEYGLIFGLTFRDKTTNQSVIREYHISTNDMEGNPYLFFNYSNQTGIFEIDAENFIDIAYINIYVENFIQSENENLWVPDIFIKNIKLVAAEAIPSAQLTSYNLSIQTPRGSYFNSNNLQDKLLKAQIKEKGKVISNTTNGLSFYWFKEQINIDTTSKLYCTYGGKGWACLNTYSTTLDSWISASDSLIIKHTDLLTKTQKYKCVVIYNKNILSEEIVVVNYNAEFNIDIISDSGFKFYKDQGAPILTCNIWYKNVLITNLDNYKFIWSSIDNNNYWKQEGNDYQLQVYVNKITNFTDFKCGVIKINSDGTENYLGAATVRITNIEEDAAPLYDLFIINGTEVYAYDENGISPCHKEKTNPKKIKELDFYILNNKTGTIINSDSIADTFAQWIFPNPARSLISAIDKDIINYGTKVSYIIDDKYSENKTENQIELQVTYDGLILQAKTSFAFVKQGEPGTNGTNVICKIIANEKFLQNEEYPCIICTYSGNQLISAPKSGDWFSVRMWEDGILVTSQDAIEIHWSVLNNGKEPSNIKYENETFSLNNIDNTLNQTENVSNIIQAEILYKNKIYYATIPVIIIKQINGYIATPVINSGFKYVVYNSDGTQPKYDGTEPFQIKIVKNGIIDTNLALYDYEWSIVGTIYQEGHWISSNCLYNPNYISIELSKDQYSVRPNTQYDGFSVNNGVLCKIFNKKEGNIKIPVATILIPIHLFLNRFGHSAINQWNGNSIDINEEEGIILSPQVGAGEKDDNNRFTGVLIGSVKNIATNKNDIGLLGYSKGQRSIFLDANSGKAEFGVTGGGKIVLDPTRKIDGKPQAQIYSDDYSTTNKTGLMIDFSKPEIKYGNGNFAVDKNGILTASGAEINGDFNIETDNGDINFTNNTMKIHFKEYEELTNIKNKWQPNTYYVLGEQVKYKKFGYTCIQTHMSDNFFDVQYWDNPVSLYGKLLNETLLEPGTFKFKSYKTDSNFPSGIEYIGIKDKLSYSGDLDIRTKYHNGRFKMDDDGINLNFSNSASRFKLDETGFSISGLDSWGNVSSSLFYDSQRGKLNYEGNVNFKNDIGSLILNNDTFTLKCKQKIKDGKYNKFNISPEGFSFTSVDAFTEEETGLRYKTESGITLDGSLNVQTKGEEGEATLLMTPRNFSLSAKHNHYTMNINTKGFSFGRWDEDDKEKISGIRWANNTLEIVGTVRATKGVIGGWEILPDKLRSSLLGITLDGMNSQIVARDEKIDGNIYKGKIIAESNKERVTLTGGQIAFGKLDAKKKETREARIYTNDKFLQEFNNVKTAGSLTLSSVNEGGAILFSLNNGNENTIQGGVFPPLKFSLPNKKSNTSSFIGVISRKENPTKFDRVIGKTETKSIVANTVLTSKRVFTTDVILTNENLNITAEPVSLVDKLLQISGEGPAYTKISYKNGTIQFYKQDTPVKTYQIIENSSGAIEKILTDNKTLITFENN